MDSCHCANMIFGFWEAQMTPAIRTKLAGQTFDKSTYKAIFKLADEVWEVNGGTSAAVVAAAKVVPAQPNPPPQGQDEVSAQVSALQRGRGRGGRGGRGRGRGQGRGSYNQNQNYNQNYNNTSNRQPQQQQGQKPHQRGPKASPDVPSSACARHWKEGKNATYCSDPLVCEWVNFVKPRQPSSST